MKLSMTPQIMVASICLAMTNTLYAGETRDIKIADLLSVYQAAFRNDAQLSAARHAYRAQIEAVPQARSGLLPNVTAGATSETTRLDRDEPALVRERSGTAFRANLSQPLFRIDRWYQLKAAKLSESQAALELSSKEQQLIFTSAQAYFETLR